MIWLKLLTWHWATIARPYSELWLLNDNFKYWKPGNIRSVLLIFLMFCVVLLCVFIFWVPCCDVRYYFPIKTMLHSSWPPVVIGGVISYLRYLCLFVYSGFPQILCCVFVLFFFVLCTPCCQFLWIVDFWLSLLYSLTFIYICTRNNHSITILFNRPAELQLDRKGEKELLIKEEKHSHHEYGFLTKSSDSYQSIDVIANSSDEQAVPVYNPHVQNYTDSYQSIQSIDSSVSSFRNSFVFKNNWSQQRNVSI